jgi:glycosyltransferase involved in cell wall biosynthesis
MLAYAVAALGWEAHLITDHVPGFLSDLDPLAPGGVHIHETRDFVTGAPAETFDWVIVIPTGIFLPDFYESCLDFAGRSRARVGLVNFETGAWFNALAPEPRDPALWDYWRRTFVRGGLVLSSARTSNVWAREFYQAPEGAIRFEVWQPPVNSVAARKFDGFGKDGSIVAFIRPQDAHKGANLLTRIDPALFAGRKLHLISGRDLPASYRAAMEQRLASAKDADLAIHLRISDLQKFRLLSSAQALLFPTLFEGYGYPPIEAAYAGTECVAFDLPVLRETVGDIAHFAPTPDLAGFETAMAAALAAPERRLTLRENVFNIGDFHRSAGRLGDILLRSADRVAPLSPRQFRIALGPYARTQPLPSKMVRRDAVTPPFPPYVVSGVATTAGETLITGRAWLPNDVETLEAVIAEGRIPLPIAWDRAAASVAGLHDTRFHLLAPKEFPGRRIIVSCHKRGETIGDPIELQIDRVAPANNLRPVIAGVSENNVEQDRRSLRGWVLAREQLTSLRFTPNGIGWSSFVIDRHRRDIASKWPGYATAQCEFAAHLAAHPEPDRERALLLCLAGAAGQERAVDALVGWPPAAKAFFTADMTASQTSAAASPPPKRGDADLVGASTKAKPRRPNIGQLELVNLIDGNWAGGVAHSGHLDRLGAITVKKSGDFASVTQGSVLRFATGAARRVMSIEICDTYAILALNGPLGPEAAGFPAKIEIVEDAWSAQPEVSFVLHDWTDKRWQRGVWNIRDDRFRRGFTIKTAKAKELGLSTGARLLFAASGQRVVVDSESKGNDTRVWLDGSIRPLADGAPHPIVVDRGADTGIGGMPFNLARANEGWPGGVLAEDRGCYRAGRAILLDLAAADLVRRGSLLRFNGKQIARALSALSQADGLEVALDCGLVGAQQGALNSFVLVDESEVPEGVAPPYRFPDAGLQAKDPLFLTLAFEAMRRGAALRAAEPVRSNQLRALVVTAVSPCPANQGNRVVTRNLIRHLVDLGYHCDIIVQNWVDTAASIDEFGATARLFVVNYPDWEKSESAKQRKAIAAVAKGLRQNRLDEEFGREVQTASENYHPYFIVRDETVELARTLYASHEYAALVCNYTHMIRVADELQDIRPLPPTAVITHDALSRLPREFVGQKLDLMYRACSAELERDVLNALPDATIVAISRSEANYFQSIGVENRIVVTEFDAAEEMAPHRVSEMAFQRRAMIFHGSANPMNLAGLDWFVDECWNEIVTAVPDARLVVCGNVGKTWKPELPGIEIMGELPREEMMKLASAVSMAINPCVAGTGLKIKTVETVCLGLPAVCLPTAVDGLEDMADRFAIVADDGPGFAAGCIALMTDASLWTRLREGALEVAESRFSAETVYGALDAAMNWSRSAQAPKAAVASDDRLLEPTLPDIHDPMGRLEVAPNDEAAVFSLGKRLARTGRADIGWPMVEGVVSARRGDWRVAAQAAAVALDIGEHWRAAIHAGTMIAQRPTSMRGYLLMGRALIGCGLPHDAVAALEQGALVAPNNAEIGEVLVDALKRANREIDARRWQAHGFCSPALEQYFAFEPRQPRRGVQGFGFEEDGALSLSQGRGTVLIPSPHSEISNFKISLDIGRPRIIETDINLEVSLEHRTTNVVVRAQGPGVQTVTLNDDMAAFDAGFALISIQIVENKPLASPLRLIGYVIEAATTPECGGVAVRA